MHFFFNSSNTFMLLLLAHGFSITFWGQYSPCIINCIYGYTHWGIEYYNTLMGIEDYQSLTCNEAVYGEAE